MSFPLLEGETTRRKRSNQIVLLVLGILCLVGGAVVFFIATQINGEGDKTLRTIAYMAGAGFAAFGLLLVFIGTHQIKNPERLVFGDRALQLVREKEGT